VTAGILNVNKPRGVTSFSVVKSVRRLTGVKKVGHAGTLDPIADGVLPICLGPATRIVDHIVGAPKAYAATIRLGSATDSFDSEGEVTATGDPGGVTREGVESALAGFVGAIQQLPPMYSALKHKGRPLYTYARAGESVEREPRTVNVYSATVTAFEPPLVEVEFEVGRGAYVRTLAHDLGEKLGCFAHLQNLTRTRSGPFTVENAVTVEEIEAAAEAGNWQDLLLPPDFPLETWQAALLGKEHSRMCRTGQLLTLTPFRDDLDIEIESGCRAYSGEGEFLGLLKYLGSGRWHPDLVFANRP
jgi:tRNA pseudouridine55 synthase